MSVLNKISLLSVLLLLPGVSHALDYDAGRFSFRLTGYGTSGIIEPDFASTLFIGDWRIRGQVKYSLSSGAIGAVYALDEAALDKGNFARETFMFVELDDIGRVEFGLTDSVARKLGIGLPDVGGLRINDRPIYNEKIIPDGPVIADTTLTSGRMIPRINLVASASSGAQYGVSFAGFSTDYDWAADVGLKLRNSAGKLKTAYSAGASFIFRPDDFDNEVYTPGVTADWRAQATLGMNVQYNSWIWGLTSRVIYDQNPIGDVSDGFVVGTGVSYDLLKYSVSLTYMFSDTGVWQSDIDDFYDNTVVASFRYKYSEFVDGWISGGTTSETPFVSAGLRVTF